MNPNVQAWLNQEFPAGVVQAFEAMTGAKPEMVVETGNAPAAGSLISTQQFLGVSGSVWLSAAEEDWSAAGNAIMKAAGVEDSDAATLKSTYLETVGQAVSALASALTGRLEISISSQAGTEAPSAPADLVWSAVQLSFPGSRFRIGFAFDKTLLDAVMRETPSAQVPVEAADTPESPSKTFDLLLEVELPVSVSFGRAQVALKDLIKLTTGSIVELNRSISEPVEVIVNNCVIARGEVVVVEGNFGVRIQQVVSRQERLRTLA